MRYTDILDKFIPNLQGEYSCLKLNAKEMRMIRLALKTQDVINDVLDEEIDLYHVTRGDNNGE